MTKTTFCLLFCLFISLISCNENKDDALVISNPDSSFNKIMPLGASRVEGARPLYESYRYVLWKLLIDGGYEFNFVGTESDGGSYADYSGMSFDRNHEGRGGINSTEIRANLNLWLNNGVIPDIVLFSSPGGNDNLNDYPQTVENINVIIDIIQDVNPNVTILIELTAPPLTSEQTPEFLAIYNQSILDFSIIAQQQTTATSRVLTVDMKTGFNDSFLADDVHYNAAGAGFIANKYYNTLINILQ